MTYVSLQIVMLRFSLLFLVAALFFSCLFCFFVFFFLVQRIRETLLLVLTEICPFSLNLCEDILQDIMDKLSNSVIR